LAGILLIGLCTVGAFGLFLFFNIQMGNIIDLAKIEPFWASLSAFSVVLFVGIIGVVAHRELGTTKDETNLSILSPTQLSSSWPTPKMLLLSLCVSVLMASISVWWLWLIAHGK